MFKLKIGKGQIGKIRKNMKFFETGKEVDLLGIKIRDNILLGILNFKSCQLY